MFSSKRNLIIILIVVTFFAYFSSLGNPFIWDDEQFITSNQYVQNFDIGKIFTTNTVAGAGVQSNYYRPLTTLSFAVDNTIWGFNSFGFHLTNTSLHIAAGILLFLLLTGIGLPLLVSFVITLFFLIHPVQTEAVTYINSRGDSLYTLFLLGSLFIFLHYLKKKRPLDLVLSLLLYIGSLLSKEIALVGFLLFPLIIIAQQGYKGLKNKNILAILSLFLLCSLCYFLLRLSVLNFGSTLNFYGAETEYTRSLAIRLFTFCKVVWVYFGILVFPYPLHMERSIDLVKSFFSPWVLGILSLILVSVMLGVWQVKKKNPWILFGLLWFFIMLIPSSGIIPINGMLYEHWLYVPMVGVSLIGYGLWELAQSSLRGALATWQSHIRLLRFASSRGGLLRNDVGKGILMSFVLLISIMYLFLTIRQNNIWSEPIVFYIYTLSFAPQSARLHNNLGMTLANQGNVREAISEYQKALSLGYGYPQVYNNLGNAQITTGDYENAEKNLQKALQLSPSFTVVKFNLIKLFLVEKEYDKALQEAGDNVSLKNQILEFEKQNK